MNPTDESAILDEILGIIGRRLDLAPGAIDPGAAVVQDLGADSLDVLCIAGEIENRFDVQVPDEVVLAARTPAEIARRLVQHLQDDHSRK